MTVNEIITQLQKMISNGEITGNEHFGSSMWLDSNDYPEVTFENSPMEVELVIKRNNS